MSRACFILLPVAVLVFTLNALCAMQEERDSPFGVLEFLHWNQSWNSYKFPQKRDVEKAAGLMKEAGVAWVRVDFLWQDIEPKRGSFDFSRYDMIVDVLSRRGLSILGVLHYCAGWASSCGQWNSQPDDFFTFTNYAAQVAQRYKGKIKYWEVWNEPDSPVYWLQQDGLKGYSVLLKDTYQALKKVDPECKVLNGGLSQVPGNVNRLYENGSRDYFDILNIHIFENPLNPGRDKALSGYIKVVSNIMTRYNDAGKKIWVTEIGCPGLKNGLTTANWWMGENPSEALQAEWVKSVYTELLKEEKVERVFWAFFRDCNEHWGNGTDYFGLVRWDYSKKPAFNAYRDFVKKWKGE